MRTRNRYQIMVPENWYQNMVRVSCNQVPVFFWYQKNWYQIAWHTYQILVPVFRYQNLVPFFGTYVIGTSLWRVASATPDLRLPSQLQGITGQGHGQETQIHTNDGLGLIVYQRCSVAGLRWTLSGTAYGECLSGVTDRLKPWRQTIIILRQCY